MIAPSSPTDAARAAPVPLLASPNAPWRFRWAVDGDAEHLAVEVRWNPRRRTRMGIAFDADDRLLVDAPPGTAAAVRDMLQEQARWIRTQRRIPVDVDSRYPTVYQDAATLHYRGRRLALRLSGAAGVWLGTHHLTAPARNAKREVWRWYARQADTVLGQAVARASARLSWVGDAPPWRHRFMSSRWGSCSARGRISLNTHLVKVSDALIEYVIVHELCHLRHLNHGPRFYRLLGRSLPDWRARRKALANHSGLLGERPPEGL